MKPPDAGDQMQLTVGHSCGTYLSGPTDPLMQDLTNRYAAIHLPGTYTVGRDNIEADKDIRIQIDGLYTT